MSHRGPVEAPEVVEALRSVDTAVGALVQGIDGLPSATRSIS